jgi:hypothetical protein
VSQRLSVHSLRRLITVGAVVVVALLVIMALVTALQNLAAHQRQAYLASHGRQVAARILATTKREWGCQLAVCKPYTVDYRFGVPNSRLVVTDEIQSERPLTGVTTPVRYDPTNPASHALVAERTSWVEIVVSPLLMLGLAAVVVWLAWRLRRRLG